MEEVGSNLPRLEPFDSERTRWHGRPPYLNQLDTSISFFPRGSFRIGFACEDEETPSSRILARYHAYIRYGIARGNNRPEIGQDTGEGLPKSHIIFHIKIYNSEIIKNIFKVFIS